MSDALSVPNIQQLPAPQTEAKSASAVPGTEQFLRLNLFSDTTVLLPVELLSEVLTIETGQIVPIPHLPGWVMGVYNWRGDVLWMVDLGHLCGLVPWYRQSSNLSNFSAVVMQSGDRRTASAQAKNQMLGLVVNRVEDIEWCDPTLIQPLPPSTVTPEFARFLWGYWWKPGGDMLAVLNKDAILTAMPK
ncbi:chemotaxis protein CheW [Oculatella sp. LEGE 06141]|uniref:chemotaxis protein CheW n=1 Tax=Oculatella sp. LEGE 06141 TaxID=1828648 RepID=UPI00187FBFBC|nr:chemotaxis protein CheW [Oculatella sp. LEGE 06141]MBE9179137.1 chemotaxis protein CheW [Oculatella sp. LEGE 06141]